MNEYSMTQWQLIGIWIMVIVSLYCILCYCAIISIFHSLDMCCLLGWYHLLTLLQRREKLHSNNVFCKSNIAGDLWVKWRTVRNKTQCTSSQLHIRPTFNRMTTKKIKQRCNWGMSVPPFIPLSLGFLCSVSWKYVGSCRIVLTCNWREKCRFCFQGYWHAVS